ncbi:hypothetical protein BKA67DRAFT_542130 [Truncatella angustata]|uniref:Uncharacterized protein n=1 Tax=Truncatella angustata TaxID=152316 RepID=A0A9P8RFN8_9PEZI|nr:uncharacterized protein BKA67DRAFT_542130 [Truncatella angustata]KAH6645153.1 hypothetical protein BKA67DRAFT_542130 [Truncatella angustata]
MAITTRALSATTPRRSGDSSSIEEVERGEIRVVPQGSLEIIPPPVIVNTAPWRFVLGFGGLALLDIAMNTAAGAAAARVGAELNGASATTLVIRMGALAGATKAAISSFREIVGLSSVNIVFQILLMLLTSSFGVCALLVTEIGNIVLGETPRELVIAAVVAAVPFIFEMVRNIQPVLDQEGKPEYFRWVFAIFLIGTDALGGYVFARMASNQGMPISNYRAACSAGAVFGTLAWLARAMTGIVAMVNITTEDGKVSNVFGVYELVTPDPVLVTEDEYEAMQRGVAGVLSGFFSGFLSSGPKIMRRFLGCFTCCWAG